jgi:hypothetical protein
LVLVGDSDDDEATEVGVMVGKGGEGVAIKVGANDGGVALLAGAVGVKVVGVDPTVGGTVGAADARGLALVDV